MVATTVNLISFEFSTGLDAYNNVVKLLYYATEVGTALVLSYQPQPAYPFNKVKKERIDPPHLSTMCPSEGFREQKLH